VSLLGVFDFLADVIGGLSGFSPSFFDVVDSKKKNPERPTDWPDQRPRVTLVLRPEETPGPNPRPGRERPENLG
jgi:hypothetical protein